MREANDLYHPCRLFYMHHDPCLKSTIESEAASNLAIALLIALSTSSFDSLDLFEG
jgi:hypothetical protein